MFYKVIITPALLIFVGMVWGMSAFNTNAATDENYKESNSKSLTLKKLASCIYDADVTTIDKNFQLTVDMHNLRALVPDILGYNPSYRASLEKLGDYEGDSFNHLVDRLTPQALRFPPGTFSSFYDWDTQTLDEDIARKYANKTIISAIQNQRKFNKGKLFISDYRSFLSLANKKSIQPFIILNIYSKSTDDAYSTIYRVKKQISDPIYWELGNELSNSDYQNKSRKAPWNSEIYLKRAIDLSKYIKQKYPDDMIGVVGAELIKERGHKNVPIWIDDFLGLWAQRVIKNSKYFDAVIYHPYINILDRLIKEGGEEKNKVPGCAALSIEAKKAVTAYQWAFSAAQEVPVAYSEYTLEFLPKKKVWLTEVGLLGAKKIDMIDFRSTGISRAMFNIVYFAHWLKNQSNLTSYMFHVLDYGRGDFSALNLDSSLNANSVSYILLQQLLRNANKVDVQVFSPDKKMYGAGPYSKSEVSPVVAMVSSGSDGVRMLVVNFGFIKASVAAPFESNKISTIGGALDASINPGEMYTIDDMRKSVSTSKYIDIHPMSINLIEQNK
jgi:hypothetical protein